MIINDWRASLEDHGIHGDTEAACINATKVLYAFADCYDTMFDTDNTTVKLEVAAARAIAKRLLQLAKA